jgi:hypothetical protein
MPRIDSTAPEQERVVAGRGALTLSLVAICGFFVVVMSAIALQGTPQITGEAPRLDSESITETTRPAPSSSPPPEMTPPEDNLILTIIGVVLAIIITAVVAVMIFFGLRMLVRYLRELWRDRPLAVRTAADVDTRAASAAPIVAEPDTETIRRGITAAMQTLQVHVDPGDSIIAAWVGLEETAADAGAGRAANETPSEFTVRIVGRGTGIAAEINTLLGLYESVRFGGRHADEDDRATASRCLAAIEGGWR